MQICAMKKSTLSREQRIELLLGWIAEGLYNQQDLLSMLNNKLSPEKQVELRMVGYYISEIKKSQSLNGKEVRVVAGKYVIIEREGVVKFDKQEKLMLPIIESILTKYAAIPGINRLMQIVRKELRISKSDEAYLENAFVFTSPQIAINQELQNAILTLLHYMYSGKACEFNYSKVEGGQSDMEKKYYVVYPIQIRESFGRLYLVGITPQSIEKSANKQIKPLIFAVDRIHKLRIDEYEPNEIEANAISAHFNYAELLKILDIERLFQNSLGVFLGSNTKIIRRYFTGWALSHVVACPLHSSQTKPVYVENVDVIHLGEEGKGKLVGLVALETYNSQELSFRLASYRDFSWPHAIGINGYQDRVMNWDFEGGFS
jgi:hypothetical protein